MIGLSLSACLKDILLQKVALSQVEYLIVSTCYRNEEKLNKIIDEYRKYCPVWKEHSSTAIRELISSVKIVQPRLKNDQHFPNIALGHWVELAEEILWQDDPNLFEKQQKRLLQLKTLKKSK